MGNLSQRFWRSNHYKHPPLTDEMLKAAEDHLAVRLPDGYVALLRVQNGGYTHRFVFPMTLRTSWSKDHVPLRALFGIVTDQSIRTPQNVLETAYMTGEWGLPPRQVLLSGSGPWWLTLDYRSGPIPKIAWINAERGEDVPVAPTFDAFLAGLVLESEFVGDGT